MRYAAPFATALGFTTALLLTAAAAGGPVTLDRATAAATAAPGAGVGFLEAQLDARAGGGGFAAGTLADDTELVLPGTGGVSVRADGAGTAIANIDARFVGERLDVSGTRHGLSGQGATLHEIRFGFSVDGTQRLLVRPLSPQADVTLDTALVGSLRLFEAGGGEVALTAPVEITDDGRPSLTVAGLAAGHYTGVLRVAEGGDDDHFAVTVSTAPAPSAVAAGLLGLAVIARRRRS